MIVRGQLGSFKSSSASGQMGREPNFKLTLPFRRKMAGYGLCLTRPTLRHILPLPGVRGEVGDPGATRA